MVYNQAVYTDRKKCTVKDSLWCATLAIRTVTLVVTLGDSKKDIVSSGTVERKSVLESRTLSLENLTQGLYHRYILTTISVAVQQQMY